MFTENKVSQYLDPEQPNCDQLVQGIVATNNEVLGWCELLARIHLFRSNILSVQNECFFFKALKMQILSKLLGWYQ